MSVLFKSLFILINFFSVIWAKQHVPVLLWSPTVSLPSVPALKQLSSIGFSEVLQDALGPAQPLIAVFLNQQLSTEDFRAPSALSKALYDGLEHAEVSDNMQYLPSVMKPMDAINELQSNGYEKLEYDGKIPSDITKPTIIVIDLFNSATKQDDISNSKKIYNIYNKIVKSYPNLLAVYTGKHNDWSEKSNKRVRRAAEPVADPISGLVMRSGNFIALANTIAYKKDDAEYVDLKQVISTTLKNGSDPSVSLLEVTFDAGVVLTFSFNGTAENWQWYLTEVIHDNTRKLVPSFQIWAPRKWSWHCAHELDFFVSPLDKSTDKSAVNITGFQVQAFIDETKFEFGQAIDCVPYFSIAIWTGIVVVVLMLAILGWGLIMLMDINNNDRFDDPKGKTITISANE